MHAGQLVLLESTTYPGTTDEVVLPELESTGLKVRKDFFLAFSPERIDPGNHTLIETAVPVSSPRVAEMARLWENTF